MKRIEEYTKQLHTSVSNYWMQKSSLWITQLCGKSGMGKTSLAQSYLEAYGGEYFSFRNLDAAFAPQIFQPGCKLWREFFAEIGETKNRPVIFFDDVDDRNDKEEFLNALPELVGKAYIVLIVRTKMELPFPSDVIQMTAITVPILLAENKALDPLDALRTIAITVFQSWCSYSIFKGLLLRIWDYFLLKIPPISAMLNQNCGGTSEHQRHTVSCFTAWQPGITVSASLRSSPVFRRTSAINI